MLTCHPKAQHLRIAQMMRIVFNTKTHDYRARNM